jgi:hypothetical protein
MHSVSPVWTEEHVENEMVIALDQEQYIPIVTLPFRFSDGTIAAAVRFRLTDEERKAIAEGADLVVSELTFGNQFTPVDIKVCRPDVNPYQ